jgi:TetR/AcrR family transcriptional regulator, transcriptional repressor for nem operon
MEKRWTRRASFPRAWFPSRLACGYRRGNATSQEKLEAALTFLAETTHGAEGKIGCMVVGAATDISTFDAELSVRVTAAANWMERLFVELIKAGRTDGSISETIDTATTAHTFLFLTQGLGVVGKTGRTRSEMMTTVQQAMKLVTGQPL